MSKQELEPINQRIKAVIQALGMNTHSFSAMLGVSDGNTRNYVDKGTKPSAEYLTLLLSKIDNLDASWLMTGRGEMFTDSNQTGESRGNYSRTGSANSITNNRGTATQHYTNNTGRTITQHAPAKATDCEKDLAAANEKIQLLLDQLRDKERYITLLESIKMPPNPT